MRQRRLWQAWDVERADARRVLGVAEEATPEELRAAYRRLLRDHHPDVAGPQHTARAAEITLAYHALRGAGAPRPGTPPAGADGDEARGGGAERVDDDSFALRLPADEAFLAILEAGHRLGEVTYVDPEGGLLETIVRFDDGSTCSAVFTTQGRANGSTEVFCTLAPLGRPARPAPPAALVVDAVLGTLGEAPRPG